MARTGNAERGHSGHYLAAVAAVTVGVAGLAWAGHNRVLAAAAAALGVYALHLLSIRFLLDNQRRQREVLDAQWEVLQRFIGSAAAEGVESDEGDADELVPAMPIDREDPERPAHPAPEAVPPPSAEPVVRSRLVPPVEALLETVSDSLDPDDEVSPGDETDTERGRLPLEPDVEVEFIPLTGADEHDGDSESASVGRVSTSPASGRTARTAAEVPVPRHFALGTVALVRDLLSPAEVARVLLEQRRQPGKKFGELAVEMGMIDESQREELLLAQQEGLFTDAEMREARRRLREFRENAAHSMAGLD